MPIYHYKCQDCQNEFDYLVGVTKDSKELKCTECGSRRVNKTLGSFSVRFAKTGKANSTQNSCSTTCCPTCR
jgi:putative FmdB family regulatory protein